MKSAVDIRPRTLPETPDRLPDDIHPVIRRILLARGVNTPGAMQLDLARMLTPESLSGIDQAARILADAVVRDQSILVVGDFDADGATGTAVAVLALKSMGCKQVSFRVPNRFEFGYGLTAPLVETLAADPPDLLLTVDSGICCINGVARARELGCRVIVTDHHLPGREIPDADAIVNPNSPGDRFPSKALAGVGVVFYLTGMVRQVLRERGWFSAGRPEPNLANLLDLVALGTVADLVPLDHNNRILVKQGLQRIRHGQARPGIMALLRAGKRDYRFAVAADLGFGIAPRLNAAGRLEDMSIGIRCLLSDDRVEADSLAAELDQLNQQRRELQQAMQEEALEQVRERITAMKNRETTAPAIILFDDHWHQGIVGLVASRIKDAMHRPVVAFAPQEPGSSQLKGSARSVKGLHVRDVLALVDAREPGLMQSFGGHSMAAGLTLERPNLERFQNCFESAVLTVLDGAGMEAELLTDGELNAGQLGLPLARLLQDHGPWGQRFPEPVFDGHFTVLQHRLVGGSHLRLTVRAHGGREPLEAIAFNHQPDDLPGAGAGEKMIRLIYRLDINRWRDTENCQLVVEKILA